MQMSANCIFRHISSLSTLIRNTRYYQLTATLDPSELIFSSNTIAS